MKAVAGDWCVGAFLHGCPEDLDLSFVLLPFFFYPQEVALGKHKSSYKQGT